MARTIRNPYLDPWCHVINGVEKPWIIESRPMSVQFLDINKIPLVDQCNRTRFEVRTLMVEISKINPKGKTTVMISYGQIKHVPAAKEEMFSGLSRNENVYKSYL